MVEVIVTATIFVTVAMISVMVLNNILKSSKKIRSQIFLYTEAHAMMDLIMRDIQRNAIDYEAYYAREVLGEAGWATTGYGSYGQSFIHPGTLGGPSSAGPYDGITGYGTYCSDMVGSYPADCPDAIPVSDSLDYETGAHPFTDIDGVAPSYDETQANMNAFCEGDVTCADLSHYVTNELILINSTGDERIAILQESLDDQGIDHQLSKVVLSGSDTNNDGIDDQWTCKAEFGCTGADNGPDFNDIDTLEADQANFLPISPSALSVEEFYVMIAPLDDPYRAFAESSNASQVQPQVTVILTVSLSNDYSSGFLGETPSITIQRTISTGVYTEIPSYESQ